MIFSLFCKSMTSLLSKTNWIYGYEMQIENFNSLNFIFILTFNFKMVILVTIIFRFVQYIWLQSVVWNKTKIKWWKTYENNVNFKNDYWSVILHFAMCLIFHYNLSCHTIWLRDFRKITVTSNIVTLFVVRFNNFELYSAFFPYSWKIMVKMSDTTLNLFFFSFTYLYSFEVILQCFNFKKFTNVVSTFC